MAILFADLVGFTSLAEDRDPEDVRDLLSRYFETCRAVIARYGGTVEKFVGDAVMAMWGAPIAFEDDAERAVRAGLDLVRAVAALGREPLLEGLAARAAVASGEAAVTVGAIGQGMVAGDVVNTASRLQTAARPGTVLVDQATYLATRGSIAFLQGDDRALRGRRKPVPAWEALRVVALRRGGGRSVSLEAPLVGRDGALGVLRETLATVVATREPCLVTVLGEAGIGKSRLVWELEKYVDGIFEPVFWHHAGTPAYGEGLAFWSLAEMVRQRAAIAAGDRAPAARRRLAACLARFVPDEPQRRWIEPFMATLVGLARAPTTTREEAFAAWRTFFERVADQGTTVLVFDDLHWANRGLLDFVESLAEGAAGRPLLLVVVARPELRDRRPTWGAGVHDRVTIDLRPLARQQMAELLRDLAPDLPGPLAERVLTRAGGVPLYAIEILRMLVDRGDLEPAGATLRVRRPPQQVDVPASLHALVAARLDALDPDERALVLRAAVLGDSFRRPALAAVAERSGAALEPLVERLAHHELLVREPGDGPAGDHLRFSHALIREVAYRTLGRRDRRALHLAAADHYAALGDLELSGQVASHVLAAYRAGPPGRADAALARRVVGALRTAAERAAAVHAHEAALAFLDEALDVAREAADQAPLHERAAAAAQASGRLQEAESHARAALRLSRAQGDRPGVARIATRLGSIQVERYDAQSIATLRAAIEELGIDTPAEDPALADDAASVELLAQAARAFVVNGRTAEAVDWADRALRRAERLDLVHLTADALAAKGAAQLEIGRTAEGVALLRASVEVAEQHALVAPGLRARSSLATGVMVDSPAEALRIAAAGLEAARRVGLRDLAVRVASNWAEAALQVGSWDSLVEVLASLQREDLPVTDRVDLGSLVGLVGALRGDPDALARFDALVALIPPAGEELADASLRARHSWALLAAGHPEEALAEAEAALPLLRAVGLQTALLGGTVPAAHAALWTGDLARLERALAELEAAGLRGRWFDGIVAALQAGLLARRGAVDDAVRRYAHAGARWGDVGSTLEAALGSLEQARLLPEGSTEAAAAADVARDRLGALGASALLDRLAGGFVASG